MASYKIYLHQPNAKEETYLILRLAENNKTYKLYTDLKIEPKHWNIEKSEARKTYSGYSDFNSLLERRRTTMKELHEKLKKEDCYTFDLLRELFYEAIGKTSVKTGAKQFQTLTEFTAYYIENVRGTKAKGTIVKHLQTLRILKEFESDKGKKITFERVNLDFYYDFKDYMTTDKGYSPNTIGKHIRNIKLFMNEATERGINTNTDFKSKRFKSISEEVESIYLTDDELLQMFEYDFSDNERLEHTRDLFLVGAYTGLRYSDFSQITTDNIKDGFISVKTQKTGERVSVPLHPIIKQILVKYVSTTKGLPRAYSNQKTNDYLKEIGLIVGLVDEITRAFTKGGLKVSEKCAKYELITTHTARRSFATNLYKAGFPSLSIMKITGHKTEQAFMKYIKISQEENAQMLQDFWDRNTMLRVAN